MGERALTHIYILNQCNQKRVLCEKEHVLCDKERVLCEKEHVFWEKERVPHPRSRKRALIRT